MTIHLKSTFLFINCNLRGKNHKQVFIFVFSNYLPCIYIQYLSRCFRTQLLETIFTFSSTFNPYEPLTQLITTLIILPFLWAHEVGKKVIYSTFGEMRHNPLHKIVGFCCFWNWRKKHILSSQFSCVPRDSGNLIFDKTFMTMLSSLYVDGFTQGRIMTWIIMNTQNTNAHSQIFI